MRRDSIFYQLFQQLPTVLFELLEEPPSNVRQYRFDSVAVKEPKFEIDGVFLPPDTAPGVVYFCEVQFQRDEVLYERLFGELFLYFYRNRQRFTDWQAVVIYLSRSTEQSQTHPYRSQLNSDQVHRVYLDEFKDIEALPLGVALMVLTTLDETSMPDAARSLLERSRRASSEESRQETSEVASQVIIEMLTTILVYKFADLSRREAEAMLGISLEETRFYREAKEEGIEQGIEQGRKSLTLSVLAHRFGEVPQLLEAQIMALPIDQIDALAVALFEFRSIADLETWLEHG